MYLTLPVICDTKIVTCWLPTVGFGRLQLMILLSKFEALQVAPLTPWA